MRACYLANCISVSCIFQGAEEGGDDTKGGGDGDVHVEVEEERVNLALMKRGQSLQDLVDGLNQLGASPRDLITILQAIQRAGAMRAQIEVL